MICTAAAEALYTTSADIHYIHSHSFGTNKVARLAKLGTQLGPHSDGE
jgi:hypothetical protein